MKDEIFGFLIGAIIIGLLLAFFIFVYFKWLHQEKVTQKQYSANNNSNNYSLGKGLSSCLNITCPEDYICSGDTFTCRKAPGKPCSSAAECSVNYFCSGICVSGATGTLDQYCPCNDQNVCVKQQSGVTLCKAGPNQPCKQNSDCYNNYCSDKNICLQGYPNAYPCRYNSDCVSKNCSYNSIDGNYYCQDPGRTSGSQGSACAYPCTVYQGSNCLPNLICHCNDPNVPGTCSIISGGLLGSCNNSNLCAVDMNCYGTTGNACENNKNCLCTYPYSDPNKVGDKSSCVSGMAEINGLCYNEDPGGCDYNEPNTYCYSSFCGGPPSLATYLIRDLNQDLVYNITNPLGNQVSLLYFNPVLPGPGLSNPIRLFCAYSFDITDYVFLLDGTFGLCLTAVERDKFPNNWTQVYPNNIQRVVGNDVYYYTLKDFWAYASSAINIYSINFFVLFHLKIVPPVGNPQENDIILWNSTPINQQFPDVSSLNPFNYNPNSGLTGIPGTQYDENKVPLTIDEICLSASYDTYIIYSCLTCQGSIYTMTLSGNDGVYYTKESQSTQRKSFLYYDKNTPSQKNYSYVNDNFNVLFSTYDNLSLPKDIFGKINYQIFDYSLGNNGGFNDIILKPINFPNLANSPMIMLVSFDNQGTLEYNAVVCFNFSTFVLPYKIGKTARCCAGANGYYIYSIASCSN